MVDNRALLAEPHFYDVTCELTMNDDLNIQYLKPIPLLRW